MSAETDLRALLAAHAPLTALVGGRIASDRMEQGKTRPFVVFSRSSTEYQNTLDGSVLGARVLFDVQVWADTRASAEAVTAEVVAVLAVDQRPVLGQSSGYDPELDLEATVMAVEWWD